GGCTSILPVRVYPVDASVPAAVAPRASPGRARYRAGRRSAGAVGTGALRRSLVARRTVRALFARARARARAGDQGAADARDDAPGFRARLRLVRCDGTGGADDRPSPRHEAAPRPCGEARARAHV